MAWRLIEQSDAANPAHRIITLVGDDRRLGMSVFQETVFYHAGDVEPQYEHALPLTDADLGGALIALGTKLTGHQVKVES